MPGAGVYADPRDRMPSGTPEELKAKYQEIKAERQRHAAALSQLEADYNRLYGQWQASQPGADELRKLQAKMDQRHAEQEQRDQQAVASLAKQNIDALQAEEAARERRRREVEQITGRRS